VLDDVRQRLERTCSGIFRIREVHRTILHNEQEAAAVTAVVSAVVKVSEQQGAEAADAQLFGDPEGESVRTAAVRAAAVLRGGELDLRPTRRCTDDSTRS
jgi:hypothetical protein